MLDVIALMMKMCVMRDGFMERQDLTGQPLDGTWTSLTNDAE